MISRMTLFQKKILVLIVASVCFYTTKFFVSPIYIIYIISLPLAAFSFFVQRGHQKLFSMDVVILTAIAVLTLIHALFNAEGLDDLFNGSNINLLLGIGVYVLIRTNCRNLSHHNFKMLSQWMLWPSAVAVSFSSVYRYFNSGDVSQAVMTAYQNIGSEFYIYKVSDPMFQDSNTTGSIALIMLSYIVFLKTKNIVLPYTKLLAGILAVGLVSTYSRAAIFSGFILLLILLWSVNRYRLGLVGLGSIIMVIGMAGALQFDISNILLDASFMHKMETIQFTINNYVADLDLFSFLTGYGPGSSVDRIGLFTHNMFLTYFVELGFLGLVLFVALMFYVTRKVWVITMPTMISALSYYMYLGAPFFFLPIALGIALAEVVENRRSNQ